MTNILDEIEQDLRRDRWNRVWQRYRWVIVGGAILVVAVVAGWRGWIAYEQSRAAQLGDRFLAAVQASDAGNHDEATRLFEDLARTGTGGFPAMARFRLANERAAKGETAEAVAAFDALANDTSIPESWRDIARLRAAMALVDSAPLAEVANRVERLSAAGNIFRHSAREVIGLSAFRNGDRTIAARWFNDLAGDPETPDGIRNRASLMLILLAADGITPPRPGTN